VVISGALITPLLASVFPAEGELGALLRTALLLIVLAIGASVLAYRLQPEELAALGLARRGSGRAALAGVAGFIVLLPVLHGLTWLWPALAQAIGIPAGPQPVLDGILTLQGSELALAVTIAVLIGPLCEEVVFRGFLQPLLVQNFHERGGIALSAFIFAILHGTHALLPLFALSLFLGWLQVQTHRIAAPFTVHALNNALTLGFALAANPQP